MQHQKEWHYTFGVFDSPRYTPTELMLAEKLGAKDERAAPALSRTKMKTGAMAVPVSSSRNHTYFHLMPPDFFPRLRKISSMSGSSSSSSTWVDEEGRVSMRVGV